MAEFTKIAWATHTFNPWIGCSPVHTGCLNCYAAAMAGRFGVTWGPHGTRRKTSDAYWRKPLKWDRQALEFSVDATGKGCPPQCRPRIFPSMCDPFEDWRGPILNHKGQRISHVEGACEIVLKMDDLRSDLFRLIDKTPNLDWLLLTKRPENVARMWCSHVNLDGRPPSRLCRHNIWILASASDQASYDSQVAALVVNGLGRCLVLGMSLEPLVGPIDLRLEECVIPKGHAELAERLSWVIVGGESGPDARPCQVEWVRSIVKQCDEAAVPCFVKQLGAKAISSRPYERVSLGISHPKGGDPSEWPEDLRVQQYPVSW